MRTLLTSILLASLSLCATGCMGTVAKRAFSEVRGAEAESQTVPGTATSKLAQYRGVDIKSPRTDLGGLVDPAFTRYLPTAVRDALTKTADDKAALFPGGAPTLEIDPEITWYHKAGGLGGLMGSDSYAVVLFWLSADGQQLGKVQVVTKSAAARIGEADMAKSCAKELANYFRKMRKGGD